MLIIFNLLFVQNINYKYLSNLILCKIVFINISKFIAYKILIINISFIYFIQNMAHIYFTLFNTKYYLEMFIFISYSIFINI